MHRLSLLTLFLCLFLFLISTHSQPLLPNDAASLLTFKSKADLDNTLLFTLHEHFDYCHWQGVKCQQGRVVRFSLPNHHLRGTIPPNSLTLLSHLRVLVLRNNSLSGPLPSLSSLPNLRSLLLDHNLFSSFLPSSLSSLPHLRVLDLSFNHFIGPLPSFNSSSSLLSLLNLSSNNFSGTIPQPLSRFPPSAFALNPNLCGDVINKPCAPSPSPSPFFDSATHHPQQQPPSIPTSSHDNDTASFFSPPQTTSHRKKLLMILAFSMGGLLLVSSFLCMIFTAKKKTRTTTMTMRKDNNVAQVATTEPEVVTVRLANSQTNELKEKCKELVEGNGGDERKRREKSGGGDLVFCGGEVKLYTLEQLMGGSAEMLGRGTMGTTYKAKLDNQLILTVKRLDAMKMSGIDGEMFERVMDTVGGMRHPNLVPVRAYFQANDERLIIFDYQPNGSVFNLIHGSRSTRAKPLHWTSCLKIAEDVAQGLAYIHQASKLIHGNLKASNVLLGTDFEACVTDYCLSALSATSYSDNEDPDSARYRGPEARNSAWKLTPKMDVYAFGVLLLELLSGKPPSQHPFLAPHDMLDWVKSMRGDDDSFEDNHLTMLVEVASLCSLTSPEQRPPMWHVLKMIQKIKASVGSNDAVDPATGYP